MVVDGVSDISRGSPSQNLRGRRALGKKKKEDVALPPPPAATATAPQPAEHKRPLSRLPRDSAEQKTMTNLAWTSEGGAIRLNGEPFHVKGAFLVKLVVVVLVVVVVVVVRW